MTSGVTPERCCALSSHDVAFEQPSSATVSGDRMSSPIAQVELRIPEAESAIDLHS